MMKEPVIDEVVARKFLLGQLSPEEQGQIEELAFEDPDTFTFLESVEEDLVDEFLQDELSPLEKQRFNDYFLPFPGRRENLKISEVLQEHFNPVPTEVITAELQEREVVADDDDQKFSFRRFIDALNPRSFWLQATTAAVVVGLLLFTAWHFWKQETQPDPVQAGPGTPVNVPSPEPRLSPSLHPSPSPVQADNKHRSRTPQKQKRSALPPEQPAPGATYAVLLMPSASLRGSRAEPLELPSDASSARVGLALTGRRNFKTYDAILENEAGRELARWSNLKAERLAATEHFRSTKGLVIDVRPNLLNPDETYSIVVTGVASNGDRSILSNYHFEAKK